MVSPLYEAPLLCRILSAIKPSQERMRAALFFREVSSQLKLTVETQSFGIAFMQRFKINTLSPRCQEILKKQKWIDVFLEWMNSPLTITLFDYSNSMNGVHPSGNQTHLHVAQEILVDVFNQQQQKLRAPFIVYLFSTTASKAKISSRQALNDLQFKIANNPMNEDRTYTRLKQAMEWIANEERSPLRKNPFVSNYHIQLISDCDLRKSEFKGLIEVLDSLSTPFSITVIPTSTAPYISKKFGAAQQQLDISKRKDRLTLSLDVSQASKRLKIED